MTEITPEELEDLRDTERAYEALIDATVGAKMIAPTPAMLEALIKDALRWRFVASDAAEWLEMHGTATKDEADHIIDEAMAGRRTFL